LTHVRWNLSRIAFAFYAALALAGFAWMLWRGDDLPTVLMASRVSAWVAFGAGIGSAAVVLAVSDRVLDRFAWTARLRDDVAGAFAPLDLAKAVALALASGIAEEVFFRGALLPAIGLVGSACAFGLLHTSFDRQLLGWTIFALAAGLGFGALFVWTGGLLAPITAHVAINGVQLVRLATSRRGPVD
jgi:uncharacterized protein